MTRSLHVALLIAFTAFAGPVSTAHAKAARHPHALQGRAHKHAHRPRGHKPAKPRQPQASRGRKNNDRGFEL
jgi:hypothetical protein